MPTNDPGSDEPDMDESRFIAELRAALATTTAAQLLQPRSSPDQLLELIVRTAARAIPCPEGALFLVDQERQVLTFDVVIGSTAAAVKDVTVPMGHGIAGLVAVSSQALAVANAQEDPRHARDVAEKSGYLPTTILAVPVVTPDGMTVGVLELLDRQDQPTFSLADMELLGGFAEQLALVLDFRRSHSSLGALLGRALAALGGVTPEVEQTIAERAAAFAARAEADPVSRRAIEIAGLVASIAGRGPAEYDACTGVLEAFASYLRATPTPGMGMEMFE